MQNKVQNISFTSNIRFVSNSKYTKLSSSVHTKVVKEMSHAAEARTVEKCGATSGIVFCIGGILKDLEYKNNFIFHWFPTEIVSDKPKSQYIRNAESLKTFIKNIPENSNLKGLLIGGLAKGSPKESLLSIRLLNLLKRSAKHIQKQDFSVFFSQKADGVKFESLWPEAAFVYNKPLDTYYVNCKKFQYIDPSNTKDARGLWIDLLDKNEIRDHFDYISISPNDKVFIGSKQIPNEEFNKNKKSLSEFLWTPY